MKGKRVLSAISCVIALAMAFDLSGCTKTVQAADLMEDISRVKISKIELGDRFISAHTDFAVKLFQNASDKENNSLVSPLSAAICMGMVANGADGETKSQIEKALGEIETHRLNEYLYSYVKELFDYDNSKINIANSIWYRDSDSLRIEKDFLQSAADYYNASAYKRAFDTSTADEINGWVKKNTNSMIDKIVDNISPEDEAYLINAIAFEAAWEDKFPETDQKTFTDYDGEKKTVQMMESTEHVYLSDENAVGFIKYYAGPYAFAAVLPNDGVDINDYVNSMTGEGLRKMISNRQYADVYASLPKFKYDYEVSLIDSLKTMGIKNAFSESDADFSKMGKSDDGNIYVSSVLHKTFIEVDENGTSAAAVTSVTDTKTSMPLKKEYYVNLNRPFVYMIIDSETDLPIFMGKVMEID